MQPLKVTAKRETRSQSGLLFFWWLKAGPIDQRAHFGGSQWISVALIARMFRAHAFISGGQLRTAVRAEMLIYFMHGARLSNGRERKTLCHR